MDLIASRNIFQKNCEQVRFHFFDPSPFFLSYF